MRLVLVDGHSVKRQDGSTICVADTTECAKQIAAAIEACHLILPYVKECGYGGNNRGTETKHTKLLERIVEGLP